MKERDRATAGPFRDSAAVCTPLPTAAEALDCLAGDGTAAESVDDFLTPETLCLMGDCSVPLVGAWKKSLLAAGLLKKEGRRLAPEMLEVDGSDSRGGGTAGGPSFVGSAIWTGFTVCGLPVVTSTGGCNPRAIDRDFGRPRAESSSPLWTPLPSPVCLFTTRNSPCSWPAGSTGVSGSTGLFPGGCLSDEPSSFETFARSASRSRSIAANCA